MSEEQIPGLRPWLDQVARSLGLPPEAVDPEPLLDVAADVAHEVIRPGAPTSTYLIGLAVGLALAAEGRDGDQRDRAGLTEGGDARAAIPNPARAAALLREAAQTVRDPARAQD